MRAGRFSRIAIRLAAAVLIFGALAGYAAHCVRDPDVALLIPQGGAKWIGIDARFDLVAHTDLHSEAIFTADFDVPKNFAGDTLSVQAMRRARVQIDGLPIFDSGADLLAWKTIHRISLPPTLGAGPHSLRILVSNERGPSMLLAYAPKLGVATSSRWEHAREADAGAGIYAAFPRADLALFRLIPLFLIVAVVIVAWEFLPAAMALPAAYARWLILAAYAILAINNIGKIPADVGYDIDAHLRYIDYILTNHRIPLPIEGWEMGQSPLYYILSACFCAALNPMVTGEALTKALRIIPLLCGAAQIEIAYRTIRYALPVRDDLQIIGAALGGLLPMNLYMAQSVSNEPLSGVLSALVILLGMRFLYGPASARSMKGMLIWGIVLGLALLAKVSAAVLVLPVIALIIFKSDSLPRSIRRSAMIIVSAALICGWYYLRNWIVVGKPFIGAWDPASGLMWWQDPGYRTLAQFIHFGRAILYPVYAGTHNLWDSVYSTMWTDGGLSGFADPLYAPPWNYPLMCAGALLALLPTAGILLGIARVFSRVSPARDGLLWCALCVAFFVAALVNHYLHIPMQSAGKASYLLGLTPAIALVGACGLDLLRRGRIVRSAIDGLFACWAVAAFLAYFVLLR